MFRKIWKKIREHEERLLNIEDSTHGITHCDKCKCMILKSNAIKGESRIAGECVWESATFDLMTGEVFGKPTHKINEHIEEVYYCQAHAPKDKKCKK